MTFDKPEHKEIVKQLIEKAQFPGHLIELAHELKDAVQDADVSADQ